ncbi:Protein of unknown function [Cotesia congregata]|uniref:EGF-like domain-containing protein n=1 Tax=Cotesia congregata TaxID=51543 RepID=A0A8J2HA84_COTCN|nr:Protein of unknown function [Cotesia congregata]
MDISQVILKATCGNDDDCNDIKHAKCSDDKDCTCIVGYSSVNKTYCAPSLNSFCWRDEKCAADHASCIDSQCQCDEDYLQHSHNECLLKLIGSSCKDNSECSRVKYAQCSAGNICVCSINTKSVDQALCLPVLNEYCKTNDDCKVENSICIDNKCQCKPNYMTLLNECQAPYLGMPCINSKNSCRFINHSICLDDRECTCLPNYLPVNNNTCLPAYNQICFNNEECATKNSVCVNYRCKCKPYYIYRQVQCVSAYLRQWCQKEEDCSGVKFATCSKDNICVCKRNYFQSDDSNCSPLLKSSCSTTEDCIVANSVCQDGKCKCGESFFAKSNDRCAKISLVQTCSTFYDCLTIPHSDCSKIGLCYCDLGYVSIDGIRCVPALGQFCTKSKPCGINNSDCIDNKCQCKPYFEEARDSECIPINFNKSCSFDIDCRDIKHSMCFYGECTCKQNYAPVNFQTCVLLLGGVCSTNEDCYYVKNSVCVSNICICDAEHLTVSNNKCEPNMLGTLCLTNDDCDNIDNSICSADNVCTCNLNYRALEKFLCEPMLNGFCSEDSQCPTDSFRCVDHQCQCQPNFTAMSASQCFETNLINTCTNVTECSDSWHAQCTSDHKCVCDLNNMALNPSTCLPILNGFCWRDHQCMAENSVCTDYHCACKPNFIAVARNLCIPDRRKIHLY